MFRRGVFLFFLTIFIFSCKEKEKKKLNIPEEETEEMPAEEKPCSFLTDSLSYNLGRVKSEKIKIEKSFYYIGEDSVFIANVFAGDDRVTCKYPEGILVKNQKYSFTVTLDRTGKEGKYIAVLTFMLSNKERITYSFTCDSFSKNGEEKISF